MSERTFLYFEDDPLSREVMKRMIGILSGETRVTIYEDSHDFAERIRSQTPTPDMVFLDIQMGPLDGIEMLRQIRKESTYDGVPVVAMTASVTVSEIEQLKQAGFTGLIAKPVRKRLFAELVQRIEAGESIWYVP